MNMKPDEFAAFLRSGALNAAPTATPYHKQEDAVSYTHLCERQLPQDEQGWQGVDGAAFPCGLPHDPHHAGKALPQPDVYKRQIWRSPIGAARPTPDRKEYPSMRTLYLRRLVVPP